MKKIYLTLALFFVALATFQSQPSEARTDAEGGDVVFEWRVKDRYRLFNQASQAARAEVDALLHTLSTSPGRPLAEHYDSFLELLSDEGRPDGHARELRRSNYRQPGGDVGRSSGRYSLEYLYPDRYQIEVRAVGSADGDCQYTTTVGSWSGRCTECTSLDVLPGQGSKRHAGARGSVAVSHSDGRTFTINYEFEDVLIVALGDSYISGEGNPDRPSRLSSEVRDQFFSDFAWGGKLIRGRHLLQEAEWWDEPCHRSLLSWPVLASVAYAARNPRKAVSLVHLGCSGAVISDLIASGSADLPGGGEERLSQLALLDRLLVPPSADWSQRRINRVLLSIGGNDLGFAGVVKTLALPPNGYTLGPHIARLVGSQAGGVCPYIESGRPLSYLCEGKQSAQSMFPELEARYIVLAQALHARGIFPGSVFHAQYPNPLVCKDNTNQAVPCDNFEKSEGHTSSRGFEALMGEIVEIAQGKRFRSWNFELQYLCECSSSERQCHTEPRDCDSMAAHDLLFPDHPNILCDRTPEPTDSEVCQGLYVHWRLNQLVAGSGFRQIDSHVGVIWGHGLTESFSIFDPSMPVRRRGSWENGLSPDRFDPYAKENERWFRLPNDSIQTQYHFYGWNSRVEGHRRFIHGTAHPTYRAQLEYAEAALNQALID